MRDKLVYPLILAVAAAVFPTAVEWAIPIPPTRRAPAPTVIQVVPARVLSVEADGAVVPPPPPWPPQ